MKFARHRIKHGVELSFRCPAIRSAVVCQAKCNQQRNRLREVFNRSHDAVIRVYDAAGNVIKAHGHKGQFKEW
jgi:hypothetical protein